MTLNGWIQILFFFGVILACTKPIGAFMHKVMEGEKHFLPRPLGWLERLVYRALPASTGRSRSGRRTPAPCSPSACFTLLVTYAHPAPAGTCCRSTRRSCRPSSRLVLQHRRQLHDQHELAGLRRRSDDELPHPDGGPGLAQLHLGRGRASPSPSRWRAASRAAATAKAPGTIGNFWVDLIRGHRLHAAADLRRLRARLRLAGHAPELRAVQRGHDARGRASR